MVKTEEMLKNLEELINTPSVVGFYPEIHKKFEGKYTYQQVYDYFIADVDLNNLYREHAQKILLAKFGKRKDKHEKK